MRSTWKGHIRMGLISAPVKMYKAIEDIKTHLNEVHQCSKKKSGPVGRIKFCKSCGKEHLTSEEVLKGFKVGEDQYAIVTKEDLEGLALKSTKIIDVDAFVPLNQIPLSYYEEPKFLAPDGDIGVKVYALIREAMVKTGRVGIGKVALRGREDVVALVPNGHGIDLYVLRYPNEVRKHSDIPDMDKVAAEQVDKKHLAVAVELVEKLHSDFKDVEMVDHYSDALRDLVNTKIAGKDVSSAAPSSAPAVDIMDALKASIAQAKDAKAKPVAQPVAPAAKAKKGRKTA